MKTINISESELRRLLNERDDLRNNLTDTVNRCNALLEDSRQKGRHIKALEVEIEALRAVLPVKEEKEEPKVHRRKAWQPPWEKKALGPTIAQFAKEQGVKITDVVIHMLSQGLEGIHVNTHIDTQMLPELKKRFPKKEKTPLIFYLKTRKMKSKSCCPRLP